ncbi:calcium-translocating P-type ATPase, partial [Lojkania enalia]
RPRRRAPTITIDTSGLINNCTGEEDRKEHKQHECVPRSRQATPHDENMDVPSKPPLEPHAANSLDSRESRPTSPHNVSSPTWSWGNSHNFLLVPGTGSRGNSLDATTENSGSASIGTYVTSSQGETLQTLRGYCNSYGVLHDEDALKPDPGTEADFEVENNKFAFSPGQLSKLLNPKSLGAFYALGGLEGLEKGLRTNRQAGLSVDEQYLDDTTTFEATTPRTSHTPSKQFSDQAPNCSDSTPAAPSKEAFADRKRVFSDNRLPERKPQSIQLAWMAYNNKALILLTAAAVISLALGLYQTFSVEPKPGTPKIEWIEGVSIIAAIAIIVIAGVLNDQQKERQFVRLNKKRDDRTVKIVRSGKIYEISVFDVVVGDVLSLEPGDIVPVDGILISGHGIKCDESSATGESDLLKKTPGDDVLQAIENHKNLKKLDPFILSGAKVVEGVGSFLVTAVGIHSSYGKVMMSLREDAEVTPLQSKLNVLAKYIAKLGSASALLLFVVVLIKFLVHLCTSAATPAEKSQNFLNILTVVITVVIVAVPERLPLAITWALAFATTRMLRDNNLVRLLRSCETMGNATTICSGKTGTLMQNKTTVISGALGTALRFGDRKFKAPVAKSPSDDVVSGEQTAESPVESTSDVSPSEFVSTLSEEVKNLLLQSIVQNTTAFEHEEGGADRFIGSRTETALLDFARNYLDMGSVSIERSNADAIQVVPFDSNRKCTAVVVKLDHSRYRMYVKGASEILLGKCDRIVTDATTELAEATISADNREALKQVITTYATQSIRTISLVYRDFESWPPKDSHPNEDELSQSVFEDAFKRMTFLAVVGVQDPLQKSVREAVKNCKDAGVYVRMVTSENVSTARALAEECSILVHNEVIMEDPIFRRLSKHDIDATIPKLCVLARSSPEDKRKLVRCLKELGDTVAVTGDGTNDAPILKIADVGFSMGIAGTEVAQEASAIILIDDNFASIVNAFHWGRAVNEAAKGLLRSSVAARLLTIVPALAAFNQSSTLLAFLQLIGANLIMDTFAAIAL